MPISDDSKAGIMNQTRMRPLIGVLVAVAITSTMDATGLSDFSALILFPLFVLFWYLDRLSRAEVGFAWGRLRHYGIALLHPLVVLAALIAIAWLTGAISPAKKGWRTPCLNFAIVALSTILVAIITEEGFFRGWLWASLRRRGLTDGAIVVLTSVAFAIWHWSAVVLDTGFNPPLRQVPLFMVNAVTIGAIWGLLRLISGSIIVSSVAHGVWNGGDYVLFGFGTKVGWLGVQNTALYGPEVGFLGLCLNLIFLGALWQLCRYSKSVSTSSASESGCQSLVEAR
jgi:membrane protease YdiL (CAAX protease family)